MAQEAPAAEGAKPAADNSTDAEPKDTANTPSPESTESPKTFDADYVKQLREENAKRRIEAQQLTERLEELEERDKSELEKAQGKATKAEERAAKAEAQILRFEVVKDKEIPAEAVDLLSGTSREELEASADKILNLVKNRTDTDTKPDFDGGAREAAPETDPEKGFHDTALAVLGLNKP